MKRAVGYYATALGLLAVLSGCGRVVDWGKTNFYQGQERDTYRDVAQPYIKSVTIYDQLTTRGMFDALWLSDMVRTAYADLHIFRQGYGDERRNAFLRRQLEENNHYISFYVLALYDAKLSDPSSHWSLFLDVNGNRYQPIEVRVVELPYEYQVFFGSRWNRFREPYLVRFGAKDTNDQLIISPETKELALHIRSAAKEHALVWKIEQAESVEAPAPSKQSDIAAPPRSEESVVVVPAVVGVPVNVQQDVAPSVSMEVPQ